MMLIEPNPPCVAYRRYSVCEPCFNDFKLRIRGKLVNVSCREYEEFVEKDQSNCPNCLSKWEFQCG